MPDEVVAAWTTDPSRHITAWTEEAEELTGYAASEALGLPARALYTPVDQRNSVPELELVAAIEGLRTFQGIRVRRDATRFAAWSRVLPLRSGEGRSAGFVELLIPDPSHHNGFALLDPQRRLQNVARATRLQLHALRLAASDPDAVPEAALRERIVTLLDQLQDTLQTSLSAMAGSAKAP
jgi:PAS domain S-box-containing protein